MRLGSVISLMYLILDNLKMQKVQLVRAGLRDHPRFVCHLTPVHFSWVNQLELWFSILQRKRGRIIDFSRSGSHSGAREGHRFSLARSWASLQLVHSVGGPRHGQVRKSSRSRSCSMISASFLCGVRLGNAVTARENLFSTVETYPLLTCATMTLTLSSPPPANAAWTRL